MVWDRPIRILSVDDHPVFREGLATIIGSQADMLLVGQATNAAEAIDGFLSMWAVPSGHGVPSKSELLISLERRGGKP
jgi:hypothetical protein